MLRKLGAAELLGVQQLQKLLRRLVGHSTVLTGVSVILRMCVILRSTVAGCCQVATTFHV